MQTREVDVFLPTHHRPHTLPYAVRSVLGQSFDRFTLHVIGDGCVPGTEEAVRAIDDPRLRFHAFPKVHGLGYANRNVVLRRTSAPFVAYMTDDDLWFPDHLERALRLLVEEDLDLVAFRSGLVRFPDLPDPHFFAYDWRRGVLGGFLRNCFTGSVSCVHRRTVFDSVGYWDATLARFGDREFYNRARASSRRTRFVDEITVMRFYAQHWDERYGRLEEPPQRRYLDKLGSGAWCRAFREAARRGERGLGVRALQLSDFTAFGLRSGPRFLRFCLRRRA